MYHILILSALFALVVIHGSSGRSITVVFSHRETFGSSDTEETNFIKLSKLFEDELKLTNDDKLANETEDVAKETVGVALQTPGVAIETKETVTHKDPDVETDQEYNINPDDDDYGDNQSGGDETAGDETAGDEFYFEDEPLDSDDANTDDNTDDNTYEYDDSEPDVDVDDVDSEDESLDETAGSKGHVIRKRAAKEQWRQSRLGTKLKKHGQEKNADEPNIWEEVTDEDLENATQWKYKKLAEYIGVTALSVSAFILIGYCFVRDPVACIFAFGTGCPCCLICCPCVRKFTDKYLDTKRLVRESLNKYMPGIIVMDDGSLQHYEATGEELEILAEIVSEIVDS